MAKRYLLTRLGAWVYSSLFACHLSHAQIAAAPASMHEKPNVVYILCDDLGYGDVHCLGGDRSKIPTPNIDQFAQQGMVFTEAHASSAVCTPSRYGILTGRYNWRSTLQADVLNEYGKSLIARDRLTVAQLLKQNGYDTACIGKWHLGWQWPRQGDHPPDFTQPILEGPTTRGFDYYFGTDIPNYPPFCFIENDRTVGIPSVPLPKDLVGHNMAGRPGLAIPGWKLENILPTITEKSCDYIQRESKAGKPFFLYFPMTSPHTPLAVTPEFLGKSGLGKYADYVMETDAMVGKVLNALDAVGVSNNTLVFFASDNGCAPYIDVKALEAKGHFPSEFRRGYKADIFDGGHRIPFLVRWPGKIKPGSSSDQLICLTDLMATCADVLGTKLPDNAGEDSVSLMPIFSGKADKPLHEAIVHHSINGSFAIRQGQWKLELCPDSGGWSDPLPGSAAAKALPPVQLYDMNKDIGEQTNEYAVHPEIVDRLTKLLEKYVADGRTTPGPRQKNDAAINLWKGREAKGVGE